MFRFPTIRRMGSRRGRMSAAHSLIVLLLAIVGCGRGDGSAGRVELVFGRHGVSEGRFHKPRAIAIDKDDRLYIVDMTARIQVFDGDGNFLRSWQTPASANGRPTGLSFDRAGHLMVADTHYFRVLFYTTDGELIPEKTIGGTPGAGPGEFNFVTDVVEDSRGNFYVSEYGEFDRIQKFSPDGKVLLQWGSHGGELGQFMRPQSLAVDEHDQIWVADAVNHRIQVFDATGSEARLVKSWGEQGAEPGKLSYPYGLLLDGKGHVYVSEFGNDRVQKFTLDGRSLGTWGRNGKQDGELHQPWAVARDSKGRLFVLDSYNHRVQRFRL